MASGIVGISLEKEILFEKHAIVIIEVYKDLILIVILIPTKNNKTIFHDKWIKRNLPYQVFNLFTNLNIIQFILIN